MILCLNLNAETGWPWNLNFLTLCVTFHRAGTLLSEWLVGSLQVHAVGQEPAEVAHALLLSELFCLLFVFHPVALLSAPQGHQRGVTRIFECDDNEISMSKLSNISLS